MAFDPLHWIDDELATLRADHLLRQPAIRGGPQSNTIVVDGHDHTNFGSNDYLGLANDPRLVAAVHASTRAAGWGSGASPLVTGRSAAQAELERHLAVFEAAEAAIVFPSGFAANLGTLGCLARRGDQVFSDAKNHASLIDGCRQSRATTIVYPHCDANELRKLIRAQPVANRRLIVTDSIFSMDGDLAPIDRLVEVAEEVRAILVVDEAHATGVLGSHGRGGCELLGVEDRVPVRIGTFSKALGSLGGFVVGQQRLIQWLYNRARPQVFSTAMPAACHAANLAALKIVREEPQRRERLLSASQRVRTALTEQGWNVVGGSSPIIAVRVGDAEHTMQLSAKLRARKLWVPGIRPPTVAVGESMLRISLSFAHTNTQLDRLIAQMNQLRGERSATISG